MIVFTICLVVVDNNGELSLLFMLLKYMYFYCPLCIGFIGDFYALWFRTFGCIGAN